MLLKPLDVRQGTRLVSTFRAAPCFSLRSPGSASVAKWLTGDSAAAKRARVPVVFPKIRTLFPVSSRNAPRPWALDRAFRSDLQDVFSRCYKMDNAVT
jgi:hypothetical protein